MLEPQKNRSLGAISLGIMLIFVIGVLTGGIFCLLNAQDQNHSESPGSILQRLKRLEKIVPVGTILPYYGNQSPEGWLICDGTPIPNEPKYRNLIAHPAPGE